MNPVLSTPSFWQPYLMLEPEGVTSDDFTEQLDGLSSDYVVRDEEVAYTYEGQPRTATYRVVEFQFYCGESFSLVVEYTPDPRGCNKTLYLVDMASGKKHQMGWWDLIRDHPYCLRPDELYDLLGFWRRWDVRWENPELPLLLLYDFVGLAETQELETLRAMVGAAYDALNLPVAGAFGPSVILRIPDDDYRWEIDKEFGWVFTSEEYPCYSLRNPAHADSDEGRFPFRLFGEMMNYVRQRLS